ncbi:cation:proton antiporter [Gelria sp. Kuro-4]|uniref:cation:proton antiporter n=1 Tax=Gelria sp. Kuro-4 TaxID=2796927 RepID=UPI001BF099AA|nr:cation:proton antiporter [Gelria sp. Kuro-4]BCV24085.1 sodium:proton antiporter [Gelria sp. Kuro-4]
MLMELIAILLATKAGGWVAQRLGQPAVLGELIAGVVLGPSVLGLLHPSELITDLAQLGVIILMFIAGLETDLQQLGESGGPALLVAGGGVVLPFLGGALVGRTFGLSWAQSAFAGAILTATSVSISAQTLMEMNRIKSREGVTILGAAVIDDVLGIIVLTLVASFTGTKGATTSVAGAFEHMTGYFLAAGLTGVFVLPRLAGFVTQLDITEGLLTFSLVACLLFSWGAEASGVAAITGAYLAGVFFSRTPYGHKVEDKVQALGYALLVPVFFINIGLNAQLGSIRGGLIAFSAAFVVVAVLGKVLGCGLGAGLAHYPWVSALRVGVGMIARGEVGIIVADLGLKGGIIDPALYSMAVLVVLLTTLVTPPLLRLAFALGGEKAGEP